MFHRLKLIRVHWRTVVIENGQIDRSLPMATCQFPLKNLHDFANVVCMKPSKDFPLEINLFPLDEIECFSVERKFIVFENQSTIKIFTIPEAQVDSCSKSDFLQVILDLCKNVVNPELPNSVSVVEGEFAEQAQVSTNRLGENLKSPELPNSVSVVKSRDFDKQPRISTNRTHSPRSESNNVDEAKNLLSKLSINPSDEKVNAFAKLSFAEIKKVLAISDDVSPSHDCLQFLKDNYVSSLDGILFCHPRAVLMVSVYTGLSFAEVALNWCILILKYDCAAFTVSNKDLVFLRNLNPFLLRAFYTVAECLQEEGVCELCHDEASHSSLLCIRYPSYHSRLEKYSGACIGCGDVDCQINNSVHHQGLSDPCFRCSDFQKNHNLCHLSHLCPDDEVWKYVMNKFSIIYPIILACKTWNTEAVDFVREKLERK